MSSLELGPLPLSEMVIYAFDVDGTLTPHPGDHPNSMWHQQGAYLEGLTSEMVAQMRALLTRLPPKLILISRNHEANIRQWLAELDPTFPERIDTQHSSFRRTGVAPTGRGKAAAFLHLETMGKPVVYVDDDLRDIVACQEALKSLAAPTYIAHLHTWLGDPAVYAVFQAELQVFYTSLAS